MSVIRPTPDCITAAQSGDRAARQVLLECDGAGCYDDDHIEIECEDDEDGDTEDECD